VQREEVPNHTDEQVEEAVCKALTLVNELDPDKDLRAAVFTQACAMYASKSITVRQPQPVDLSKLPSYNWPG
jgi:hypothetical protein